MEDPIFKKIKLFDVRMLVCFCVYCVGSSGQGARAGESHIPRVLCETGGSQSVDEIMERSTLWWEKIWGRWCKSSKDWCDPWRSETNIM